MRAFLNAYLLQLLSHQSPYFTNALTLEPYPRLKGTTRILQVYVGLTLSEISAYFCISREGGTLCVRNLTCKVPLLFTNKITASVSCTSKILVVL